MFSIHNLFILDENQALRKSISQQKIPWTFPSGQSPLPVCPPPVEHLPITASSLRPHSATRGQPLPTVSLYCSLAYRGPEAAAEEPGALARAAHQLALVVALAALHLAGVPVAGGGGAGLAEALHQVPGPGVDGGALQQLAPRPAVALARAVVELGHAAALHQGELSSWIFARRCVITL